MMLEKIVEALFAYCFTILEAFFAFIERTHSLVGVGLPLLVMVGVHQYLPIWVETGLAAFVLVPATTAMLIVIVEGLVLTRHH